MPIDPVLPSIVALRAMIPEEAFTASTLGTLREGQRRRHPRKTGSC